MSWFVNILAMGMIRVNWPPTSMTWDKVVIDYMWGVKSREAQSWETDLLLGIFMENIGVITRNPQQEIGE